MSIYYRIHVSFNSHYQWHYHVRDVIHIAENKQIWPKTVQDTVLQRPRPSTLKIIDAKRTNTIDNICFIKEFTNSQTI